MGIVSDYLRDLVARQVSEKGVVVWFDPEGQYQAFVQALTIPHSTIARYAGSFFALRQQVDALLEQDEPPRLVVYVPLAEEATQNALIELVSAGTTLKPGHAARPRNTRLSVVAKGALREAMTESELADIEKQVEEKKLSLADLDRLADQGGTGVLVLLFESSDPAHVALALLDSTRYDAQIQAKQAQSEIARPLKDAFGVDLPPTETLEEWRVRLARHLLCTDLLASLRGPLPPQLVTLTVAPDERARAACLDLARTWRQRRDLDDSYARYASRVEGELGLGGIAFALEQLQGCETFAAIEHTLQTAVESALLAHPSDDLLALVQRRKSGYWSAHQPELAARWELVLVAARLLRVAGEIEAALKPTNRSAADLFRAYTEGEHPWCELDTFQRRLEYRSFGFDFDDARHRSLVQLVHRARQRYMEVGGRLSERFVRAFAASQFRLPGIRSQRQTFTTLVAPAVREGKTAYLLVDALRFEMARELARDLGESYRVTLSAGLGTVPSITDIGMAAL
ncbi:MAG TPA: PglZ domain-containing protein, partial [Ktedonobacterales bacterium]|nr:PglZ domain-containing protein [Ktedonobacterales bacterium]